MMDTFNINNCTNVIKKLFCLILFSKVLYLGCYTQNIEYIEFITTIQSMNDPIENKRVLWEIIYFNQCVNNTKPDYMYDNI